MSELIIDHSPALGDIVIRISQEEIVRLTMLMYGQRTGVVFHGYDAGSIAASVVDRMYEIDEDTGLAAIEGFIATLGCDHLIQDTTAPEQVEAHLAAEAEAVSNVVPIREELYSDESIAALLAASIDTWCAEADGEQAA